MDKPSSKSDDLQENQAPKKHFITVKSRYLESAKKFSSQSDKLATIRSLKARNQNNSSELNSTSFGNGSTSHGASTLKVQASKPERVSKTSTPTKDVSLFASDLSVVHVGAELESHKQKHEDPAKLADEVSDQYNTALLCEALDWLVDEQQSKFAQVADRELAALQKAVEDSTCTLSTLDTKINIATSLTGLQEDLGICEDVFAELIGDPVFSDSNSFKLVTSELESLLNQLPCKNVKIPTSHKDLDEIQIAAAKLAKELCSVSLDHGDEIERVSCVKSEMSQIDALSTTLAEAHSSVEELMPIATSKVLDKISTSMMNSALANMDIKF